MNRTLHIQRDRPVPGISKKRGQNEQNWPESKESASAGYFKKEGAESKELARIKEIGQCRVFQKRGGRIKRTGGSGYFQPPQPTQLGFHY
jgi:hypothetical protein